VTWRFVVGAAVSDVDEDCGVFAFAIQQSEPQYDSSERRQSPAQRHGVPWQNSIPRRIKSHLQESSSEQEGGIADGKYHKLVPEICGSKQSFSNLSVKLKFMVVHEKYVPTS
jgi:hypothetical protein